MKLSRLASVVALVLLSSSIASNAGLFAYNGYAVLNNNGGGNTYYDLDANTANPNFAGATFTLVYGQTLKLGGQVTADGGNGQPASNGPEWARIYYKIDSGSFNFLDLPYLTDFGTSGWKKEFEQANPVSMVDLANGLSVGSHSLVVYIQAHDNDQPADGFVNNGGANFSATISVVPEPINIALGIFGALGFVGFAIREVRAANSRKLALSKIS